MKDILQVVGIAVAVVYVVGVLGALGWMAYVRRAVQRAPRPRKPTTCRCRLGWHEWRCPAAHDNEPLVKSLFRND